MPLLPFIARFAFCSGGVLLACLASAQPERSIVSTNAIVFADVNVVPMDRERILEHQTVVVRDGRIVSLGPTEKTEAPASSTIIQGHGAYLMPGLTDMHAHLKSPWEFPVYLANGVTTVYNLMGRPVHLRWRDQIAQGKILGPAIFTCGPIIYRASTAEEGRRFVEEQSQAGYDSVKIYNDVSNEAYPTIVATARQKKMLVVGHIPRAPGLEGVLKARQPIAHLEEYVYTFLHDRVDDESPIPAAVNATRDAGVPVITTLVNFDHILRQAEDLPAFLNRPETKYLTPWSRETLGPQLNFYHNRRVEEADG